MIMVLKMARERARERVRERARARARAATWMAMPMKRENGTRDLGTKEVDGN
jgi:hypothetical protein